MIHYVLRALAVLSTFCLAIGCAAAQIGEPDGQALFARYCASCHGRLGEGDGPVAQVMEVSVPNLRTLRRRADGTFPRDAVMRYIDGRELPAAHGARLMPVWGDSFSGDGEEGARRRIAAITDFIERLQN
jgi:mono/diheme cytochrome c family protein